LEKKRVVRFLEKRYLLKKKKKEGKVTVKEKKNGWRTAGTTGVHQGEKGRNTTQKNTATEGREEEVIR